MAAVASSCVSCGEALLPGAAVVQFGGASLHPSCYRCAGPCKMQLSVDDTVYTHHANPWCKRCYAADVERPCWRCKESIQFDTNGRMAGVGAGSTSFHHHCYCCKECGKKFAIADSPGEKCFEVGGEHYCEKHAREQTAKEKKKKGKAAKDDKKAKKVVKAKPNKCAKCKKKDPPPMVLADSKHWHEGCQPCKSCKKSVLGQEYIIEQGLAYCSVCAETVFLVKCAGCGLRIMAPKAGTTAKHVRLPFGTFHMDCFVCSQEGGCTNPLIVDGASAAFMHEQRPYCGVHYKVVLAAEKARRKSLSPSSPPVEEKRGLADYGGYGSPTPGASAAAKARAAGGGGGGGAGGASAVEDGDENYAVPDEDDDVQQRGAASANAAAARLAARVAARGQADDYADADEVGANYAAPDEMIGPSPLMYETVSTSPPAPSPAPAPPSSARPVSLAFGGGAGLPPAVPTSARPASLAFGGAFQVSGGGGRGGGGWDKSDYEEPVSNAPETYATIDDISEKSSSPPGTLAPRGHAAAAKTAVEEEGDYMAPAPLSTPAETLQQLDAQAIRRDVPPTNHEDSVKSVKGAKKPPEYDEFGQPCSLQPNTQGYDKWGVGGAVGFKGGGDVPSQKDDYDNFSDKNKAGGKPSDSNQYGMGK